MIQLKMGQDLLLQVTRGITLQLVALISEISAVTHPPSLAGVPQATDASVYCQPDERVWTLASPPHLNRRGKKITLVARMSY